MKIKYVGDNHPIRHANYTIDDDGRFHSKADGKFVTKKNSSWVSPDQLSTDELKKANNRRTLENKYNQLYPSRSKQLSDALSSTQSGLNTMGNALRQTKLPTKKNPRVDLSNLSDEQLRKVLNREQMERQYDQYFNTPVESKGQKFIDNAATIIPIIGGAVGIAVGATALVDWISKGKKKQKKKDNTWYYNI